MRKYNSREARRRKEFVEVMARADYDGGSCEAEQSRAVTKAGFHTLVLPVIPELEEEFNRLSRLVR